MHSVLTLLVASSIQWAADVPRVDLQQIAIEITQVLSVPAPDSVDAAAEPTVRDIPFYFDDFAPLASPETPLLMTYDWRSPVVFDLP